MRQLSGAVAMERLRLVRSGLSAARLTKSYVLKRERRPRVRSSGGHAMGSWGHRIMWRSWANLDGISHQKYIAESLCDRRLEDVR